MLFHVERIMQDISIHALREESDSLHIYIGRIFCISIHALREESDPRSYALYGWQ